MTIVNSKQVKLKGSGPDVREKSANHSPPLPGRQAVFWEFRASSYDIGGTKTPPQLTLKEARAFDVVFP